MKVGEVNNSKFCDTSPVVFVMKNNKTGINNKISNKRQKCFWQKKPLNFPKSKQKNYFDFIIFPSNT